MTRKKAETKKLRAGRVFLSYYKRPKILQTSVVAFVLYTVATTLFSFLLLEMNNLLLRFNKGEYVAREVVIGIVLVLVAYIVLYMIFMIIIWSGAWATDRIAAYVRSDLWKALKGEALRAEPYPPNWFTDAAAGVTPYDNIRGIGYRLVDIGASIIGSEFVKTGPVILGINLMLILLILGISFVIGWWMKSTTSEMQMTKGFIASLAKARDAESGKIKARYSPCIARKFDTEFEEASKTLFHQQFWLDRLSQLSNSLQLTISISSYYVPFMVIVGTTWVFHARLGVPVVTLITMAILSQKAANSTIVLGTSLMGYLSNLGSLQGVLKTLLEGREREELNQERTNVCPSVIETIRFDNVSFSTAMRAETKLKTYNRRKQRRNKTKPSLSMQQRLEKLQQNFARSFSFQTSRPQQEVSRTKLVIDQCTMTIARDRGKIVQIVGPVGAGKSTLLMLLIGALTPTTGDIYLNGMPIQSIEPQTFDGKVAIVLQNGVLLPGSVGENLVQFNDAMARDEARNIAQELGLVDVLDTQVDALGTGVSGGQRQIAQMSELLRKRVTLALIDEPYNNLDKPSRQIVMNLIRNLKARGALVLLVTHQAPGVPIDEVVFIDSAIVKHGTVNDVLGQRPQLAQYIEKPPSA